MNKKAFFIRRVIQSIFILFFTVTIIFFMFRIIPSDPTSMLIDSQISPEDRRAILAEWGLDKPIHIQYLHYIRNLMTGDFGISFYYRTPVLGVIAETLTNTFVLMGLTMAITVFGAILGGAYLGWRRGSRTEKITVTSAIFIHAMPLYWTGIVALMLFTYYIRLFPTGGMHTMGHEYSSLWGKYFSLDFLHHLVLPLVCALLYYLPNPMLIMRASMLEVKGEDFLEMSTARGFRERTVIMHCARNALIPVITHIAIMSGFVFGGQVLLETVFTWPGMGRELVKAVMGLDYPVAQAIFFLMATTVILMNLVADLLYGFLDPRITYK